MIRYIIFIKTPINLNKTYYRNERRDITSIRFTGTREELLSKIQDLRDSGREIDSVCNTVGQWVKI